MPLPMWLARFNRRVTNRIAGPIVQYLPGYGVLVHVGRRTGRTYRTPINLFRRPGGFVIALTYGERTEWSRNVLAAGGCIVERRRMSHRLVEPRVVTDPRRRLVPPLIRVALAVLRANQFLVLSEASP
jgi:deazaflavin-dependent oxidoreductase (nitroreductase family)